MAGPTAPNYYNYRIGGLQGGRIPTELFPATFLMSQDSGASANTLTLSPSRSAATQPTVRAIDGELSLAYAGSTTVSGSVASVRGNTTVQAATTITGASYIYGTQGKVTVKGTMSGSAEVSCGILGQLDLSAALGVTAPMAAIWGDMGATMGTVTGANLDICVLYNTTSATINSAIRVYSKSTYFMDLSDNSSGWIVATAASTGWDKSLKINLNGTTYYIPCNPAAS